MHPIAKTIKLIGIFLIIIIAVSLLPACATKLTPAQIVVKVSSVLQNTKNYNISATTTIKTEGDVNGDPNKSVTVNNVGTVDETNNAFSMNSNTSVLIGSSSSASTQIIETYMVNNTVYERTTTNGVQAAWINNPANNSWSEISFIDIKKVQNLLVGAQVTLLNQETIEGTPCYVLNVGADPKKLFDMMSEPGMNAQNADSISYWDHITKDFSSEIWVAKDSFNLIKMEYKLYLSVDSQYLGQPAGSPATTTNLQVSAIFSNYNTASDIVVPSDARATIR